MATTYKVLGQSNPAATTSTNLYVVPALTSAVVSTITVANLAATDATFRLSVAVAGAILANSQYIAYDITVPGASQFSFTLGITLATTDVIRVFGSTANLTFTAFGSQIT